jgi:transcription antitermination factor NusG
LPQVGNIQTDTIVPVEASIPLAARHDARWFAVCTTPRHEKRVAHFLAQRQLEHFLPLYRTVRRWKNGCKAQLELPLFPGYLFVKIGKMHRIPVLNVPGIITFVGTHSGPSELDAAEIEAFRAGLHQKNAEPYCQLAIGQRVRIKTGALAGLTGTLLRNAACVRVILTVALIHQSVAVEVDAHDVEPVEQHPSNPSYLSKGHA